MLKPAELATLVALVEEGPLWDGDVPSKAGRDGLLDRDLIVRVIVNCQDGWQAATPAGGVEYKRAFPNSAGEIPSTMAEAKTNRLAAQGRSSACISHGLSALSDLYPDNAHVCGWQGFVAFGDICPGCTRPEKS